MCSRSGGDGAGTPEVAVPEVRPRQVGENSGPDQLALRGLAEGEVMSEPDEAAVFNVEALNYGMNEANPIDERVRNLYAIIVYESLPDGKIDTIVRIIETLERLTCSQFKDTADFHKKIGAFLVRKSSNGKLLREFRKSKGWSQGDLAIHLAVSQQFVAKMESDKTPLTEAAHALIMNLTTLPYAEASKGCETAIDSKQDTATEKGTSDNEED